MVQWFAGQHITAGKLSTTHLQADCNATLTVDTTVADVSGMSLTFVTTRDNVTCDVWASLDVQAVGADPLTGALVGRLDVDGSEEARQLIWNAGTNNTTADEQRSTPAQTWTVTLASAGNHTIKVRANRSGGTAGDLQVRAPHSTLKVNVEDNV
jgi:hypothetical protein